MKYDTYRRFCDCLTLSVMDFDHEAQRLFEKFTAMSGDGSGGEFKNKAEEGVFNAACRARQNAVILEELREWLDNHYEANRE